MSDENKNNRQKIYNENTNENGEKIVRSLVLSDEEVRVLRECNKESFYYRCIPAGAACIAITQLLTNRRVLQPHPKFGALFKNLGAGFVGYVIGKASYQGECRKKLMQLKDSPLAEALRKGQPISPRNQEEPYSGGFGVPKQNEFDIETRQKTQPGQLEKHSSFPFDNNPSPLPQNTPDYDELRAKNREAFQNRLPSSNQKPKTPVYRGDEGQLNKNVKRNKYGDIIEE